MPRKKYIVDLTDAERAELLALTTKGTIRARKMKRAQILLKADDGLTDVQIMEALRVSRPCVERVRQRFVAGNLDRALNDNPRPGKQRKLSDRQEARLIAEACTPAPAGRKRWTIRLLTERMVALQVVDSLSRETVRRVLKKTRSSPGSCANGIFPQ
jgi:putative transposase